MSLGTIKDYTPNFNLIIPEFNISGWHDYLEENFRSIDALFYNLFGINNYSGIWKKLTSYTTGQVVFIGEDTNYSGRLVKVLVNHTTTNDDFTTFFTNNPTYYELFADASTAQYYAIQAKDWAIKTDGPVEGSDYSAKYYADIVNSLSTEITTLYNIANEIQTVANISTDVENVADNETNINTVATNISDISTVSSNITKISNVNDDLTNINTVSSNISAVNTTATNATNIITVANNITDINTVASISSNVTSVAGNATNINTVASNNTNITTVAQDLTNININATNITAINTTATNISDINTAASNITVIQNASTYATNAANSASLAENWAIKIDGPVSGGEYSAKYWANEASSILTNKANIDLSNISSTGQKVLDGQWVGFSTTTIASGVSQNTSDNVEYDLSSVLPNDNYNYEVIINGGITTGSTVGNTGKVALTSSLINDASISVILAQTRSNASIAAEASAIIPIGTDRKLIKIASSNATGLYYLNITAYRRIGTNS